MTERSKKDNAMVSRGHTKPVVPAERARDTNLVTAWRAGHASARDELLGRHYDQVFRYLEARAPGLGDDLTQKTMMACCAAIPTYRGQASFRTFLHAIARRQLASHFRKPSTRCRPSVFEEEQYEPSSVMTPSRVVSLREEHRLLLYALAQLPETQRVPVERYYWAAKSTKEIAAELSTSVTNVTTRIARARSTIRAHIADLRPSPHLLSSLEHNLDGWARSLGEQQRAALPVDGSLPLAEGKHAK